MAKPIIAVSGLPDGLGQASSGTVAAWLGLAAFSAFLVWATLQPVSARRGS